MLFMILMLRIIYLTLLRRGRMVWCRGLNGVGILLVDRFVENGCDDCGMVNEKVRGRQYCWRHYWFLMLGFWICITLIWDR